ncbi:hypothetical protein RNN93_25390, partial [Escherichia coli]|nr:hypothetical protein [Escherichia coli]
VRDGSGVPFEGSGKPLFTGMFMIFPCLVAEGVMYERLVVPLIHHIQKLTERVEELESELKLLSTS